MFIFCCGSLKQSPGQSLYRVSTYLSLISTKHSLPDLI
ncbi:hypothetical protein CGRA01v4_14524 [Colletotrichum graminicola]|nr:hypothetical protein CGRA01v4_14524 [Colletotrichum graminicola]